MKDAVYRGLGTIFLDGVLFAGAHLVRRHVLDGHLAA